VTSAAFSPDGARLATASLDGTVKVWDAATGQEQMRLLGNVGNIHSIAFTPANGGAQLVIGGDGISLYLLRLEELIALARSRLTRSLTADECRRYLRGDEAVCASLAQTDIAAVQLSSAKGRACQAGEVGGQDSLFNQLQYNGARSVAERFGWEVLSLESLDPADYDRLLATFLASDCDLIMTGLFSMSDATKAAAEANPHQKYFTSDVAYDPPLDNVWTSVYATDEAAFLAGYVAASVSQTGRIGTFGGIDIPPVTDFMDGFALGAAYYNAQHGANVQVLGWNVTTREGAFTGNFWNEGDGRRLAEQLMNDGADVVMPVAGPAVGWGAAKAVQEREGVYFVGVDVDWTLLAPEFADITLTSVEKRYDASAAQAVQAVIDGAFTGGIHVGALENGGVGISPFHNLDALVSPQVKAELEQIAADIIAGKITTRP
jgi:basic membrane protein A